MKSDLKMAYAAATLYAILIGLSFLFSKIALTSASPLDVLAYRFLASFIALSIPVVGKMVSISITPKRIRKLLPLVVFYPLMFFSFQTFGLIHASSSEAGIIQAAAPVFIMILAGYFLGEKLNTWQKASVFLSVLGVLYILVKKGSTIDLANAKGVILLLCSVLSFAGYNVLTRKLIRDFTNWEISYVMLSISFVFFGLLAIFQHLRSGDLSAILLPLKQPSFVFAILYLGVFSTLGTSMLNNFALSKLEASRVSVFGNLGTVISMVAGVLFLQEKLYYYHILGSILIVGGVVGTNLASSTHRPKPNPGQ